jgi:hypothetical protein
MDGTSPGDATSEDFTLNIRLVDGAPPLAGSDTEDCTSDGCTTTKSAFPC